MKIYLFRGKKNRHKSLTRNLWKHSINTREITLGYKITIKIWWKKKITENCFWTKLSTWLSMKKPDLTCTSLKKLEKQYFEENI